MAKVEKLIFALIEAAKEIGLKEVDLTVAKELLENREYGLSFDIIISQLYEYEYEIDKEFYELIASVAKKMDIPENDFSFMKELIRTDRR